MLFLSIHAFTGDSIVGHHDFRPGVDKETAEAAWSAWLAGVFG